MLIYANGDSFVAGVELGDDIMPDYPGTIPYNGSASEHERINSWIRNTYNPDHPLYKSRQKLSDDIMKLEYQRAFPSLLSNLFQCPVVNHAFGGSSIDRIVRTSIFDLIELKKTNQNIIALIGTTELSRFELPSPHNHWNKTKDFCGHYQCWKSINVHFPDLNDSDLANKIVEYTLRHERNYHSLVRFYKNVIQLQDFCKLNGIKLFWISAFQNVLNTFIEPEYQYKDNNELESYMDYAKFEYFLDMHDVAATCNLKSVLCPSGHYSKEVHTLIAEKLFHKLQGINHV